MSLLECDWGRRIGLPGDDEPCTDRAERDMVLHDPHNVTGGQPRMFRLCGRHFAAVQAQTDPHAEVAR